MIFEFIGLLDDITGNVVSESLERSEERRQEEILNRPSNKLALRKLKLVDDIKSYNRVLKEYSYCESLVEIYSKWKNEALNELNLLK